MPLPALCRPGPSGRAIPVCTGLGRLLVSRETKRPFARLASIPFARAGCCLVVGDGGPLMPDCPSY